MSAIKVAVRVRPLNRYEVVHNATNVVRMKDDTVGIVPSAAGAPHIAAVDHVFWSCDTTIPGNENENATQEVVYSAIGMPMVQNIFDGRNPCLFSYGQTGSGKTYSVIGDANNEGIALHVGQDIFQRVKAAEGENREVVVEVSFLDMHNETLRDLLQNYPEGPEGKKLQIREHPKQGTFVEGLSQIVVTNARELHDMVVLGSKMRESPTRYNMSSSSSRSHGILTVRVTQITMSGAQVTTRRAHMHLVDMAGSEELRRTSTNAAHLREMRYINKSTSIVRVVMQLLAEGAHTHIPYRDSQLTRILKDAFGGNCMTTMLATISPASTNYVDTISTLRLAECARKIMTKPVVNESTISEGDANIQKEGSQVLEEGHQKAPPGTTEKEGIVDVAVVSEVPV